MTQSDAQVMRNTEIAQRMIDSERAMIEWYHEVGASDKVFAQSEAKIARCQRYVDRAAPLFGYRC